MVTSTSCMDIYTYYVSNQQPLLLQKHVVVAMSISSHRSMVPYRR